MGSSETAGQSLREELKHLKLLKPLKPEVKERLSFFVGDMSDNTYLEEAMSGANFVLFVPAIPRPFDCEVAPAVTTINFLETIATVLHTATDCGVEKTVVISSNRQEPFVAMPDMLAALMESVVVAQGRYLGKDSQTAIICARQQGDLCPFADFAFAHAANADLLVQTAEGINRIPCENFAMQRN